MLNDILSFIIYRNSTFLLSCSSRICFIMVLLEPSTFYRELNDDDYDAIISDVRPIAVNRSTSSSASAISHSICPDRCLNAGTLLSAITHASIHAYTQLKVK